MYLYLRYKIYKIYLKFWKIIIERLLYVRPSSRVGEQNRPSPCSSVTYIPVEREREQTQKHALYHTQKCGGGCYFPSQDGDLSRAKICKNRGRFFQKSETAQHVRVPSFLVVDKIMVSLIPIVS